MPELPEVETVARELARGHKKRGPSIVGQKITGVTLTWPRQVVAPSAARFRREIPGQKIRRVGRRGKYLLFGLTRDTLVIHLKMSGDLRVIDARTPTDTHARAIFQFAKGLRLCFIDARKFGRLYLVKDPGEVTGSLGPEPLGRGFTPTLLQNQLSKRRRSLKPLLLDQKFIAGLGNIYVTEALFLSKLHPLRRSDSLTGKEVKALWRSIRQTLREGIKHNGASLDWVYQGGEFQNYFRVYDREEEPCPSCRTPIERIVVAQRGSFFCPRCQPLR